MLAAIHVSQMSSSEQISTFDSMFNNARFSAVLQFYAAITKLCTSRPLLNLVPRFLRPVSASIYDLVRKITRKGSDTLFISLLNCLYEAQDTDLCKYVGKQLRDSVPYFDKLDGYKNELYINDISLFSHDCLSIGYFLASIAVTYKGEFAVDLGGCRLGDMGIKIFIQSLHKSLSFHGEIIGHLKISLGYNDITGEGASYIAGELRTTSIEESIFIQQSNWR